MLAGENIREHNMLPPPAPRKVHVRKMIKVSSRVRRKLNFDMAAEPTDAKKIRIGPVSNDLILQSNAMRSFQPISFGSTLLPGQTTPVKTSIVKTQPIEEAPTLAIPSTQTNINELIKFEKESNENRTLMVDAGIFTTPDKCICKNSRERSEFVARLEPLRL